MLLWPGQTGPRAQNPETRWLKGLQNNKRKRPRHERKAESDLAKCGGFLTGSVEHPTTPYYYTLLAHNSHGLKHHFVSRHLWKLFMRVVLLLLMLLAPNEQNPSP